MDWGFIFERTFSTMFGVEVMVFEIQRPSALSLGVDFLVPLSAPKDPSDLIAAGLVRPGRGSTQDPTSLQPASSGNIATLPDFSMTA